MSECAGCDKGLPVDRNDFLGWYHYVTEDCGCEIHSGQRYAGKCVTRNLPTKQGEVRKNDDPPTRRGEAMIATCPNCGLDFPERDPENEPVYECVECGARGYDCCIPGNNGLCPKCEEIANAD